MTADGAAIGIGSAITRREDPAALRGTATFTDDLDAPGLVHLAFVRSRHAHAAVEAIGTGDAEAMEGVLGVFTPRDISTAAGDPLGRIPLRAPPFPDAPYPPEAINQPVIAAGRVRHQGEILAVVAATDRYLAHDAADRVRVEYDRLESVTGAAAALDEDAPTIHEACPDNLVMDGTAGDAAVVEAGFADAAHTVSLDKRGQRLAPFPLEPRGVLASYDAASDRLTFRPTTQIPHAYRRLLATMLDHPENRIEVVAPSMGGGFGARQHPYPEDALAGWCAMHLDRPVKWRGSRHENQESETDGRGYEGSWELAVDDEGRITGLRADILYDLGAWIARASPALAQHSFDVMTGQYDVPAAYCRIRGVLTNASRVDAYRGVTETDMIVMLERLMDRAAPAAGLDPAEIRRRNFVEPDAFPGYTTATGATYDSGDYRPTFDKALDLVGYGSFRDRQAELREEGRYVGIGMGNWIEKSGLGPCGSTNEPTWGYGRVQVHSGGEVTVTVGSSDHGQGHRTTMAQIAADRLGVPFESIEIVQNDTERVPEGVGTYAARSGAVDGAAVAGAAEKVHDKVRRVAAHRLEVDPGDLEFVDREFRVTGAPDRSLPFDEVAHRTLLGGDLPEGMEPGLEAQTYFDPDSLTWPFGTHVAAVEVDPATGEVSFEDYVVVEDCGTQINPIVVEGQIHGATAQGIGQALLEDVVYDEGGGLVTGSLLEYALPRARHMPDMRVDRTVTPCPHNPLGAKGMGESGSIGAPAAVANAIEDAIRPLDADPIDLPATPERVWRAIHGEG